MSVQIRPVVYEDLGRVSTLLIRTFDRFLGPEHSAEGVASFHKVASHLSLEAEFNEGNLMLLAEDGDEPAGFLGMKGPRHLKFLFVDEAYHRRGIAARLWAEAKSRCLERDDGDAPFTVNASDYALSAYARLGFHAVAPRTMKDGIVFTPMHQETGLGPG